MTWEDAPDIQKRVVHILANLDLPHILGKNLIVYRSHGSTGRAIARIWSLPRVWQQALNVSPHYIIEVISERFDRQSHQDQDRTLIHELMHIPKTFSGALVSHRGHKHRIDRRSVEALYRQYVQNKNQS
ncbi:MAG: Metallopeptidase-like protein [Microgenomates group bacterium GW2011_GWA1_48_10]|uniref:Putative phage metallopeptidase domain-containing protein n=1 Tax=Candidatus Gottesmanbacteria bacterium RIFCSPHIGHO2_01_FULL_47_48 TaxID=1798381 RepID=A0A1F5ZZ39_9BACT|nr:MAG: Metallopeptidase-like protein [Microgenomates group bacterium GW2011_GWA1_48_10]OGG17721.1 MAG: hypothetical protein A2721_00570 [Candidatus Gottesmanbacteria bacterium RIFCSPHIGHO2_01_FULL_47_48]